MLLLSWNIAGRVRHLDSQVEALTAINPDLVALQEVRLITAAPLCERLSARGLSYCITSFDLARSPDLLVGPRQYGQLIASRWPLKSLPPKDFKVPWPERILSTLVAAPFGSIELHTTHIPPGVSNGWTKVEMFEGLFKRLACHSQHSRILCGDFNSPMKEFAGGYLVTAGQWAAGSGEIVCHGNWSDPQGREDKNARWDLAERNVLTGLTSFDLHDVFRTLNGYLVEEYSHYVRGKTGRRFDHIFASRALNAVKCGYIHRVREAGLSDHSAIFAAFEPIKVKQD
jgi:exodeoxyribonuclease III